MATAKHDTDAVERKVVDKVSVVRLTLSRDEAQALHSILRNVGGRPDAGRKHADSILKALDAAGGLRTGRFLTRGTIYFGEQYTSLNDYFTATSNPFNVSRF